MTTHRTEGSEADRNEQVQELDARHAAHVKGGFNPQPEPPKVGAPIIRFVINPADIRG